MNLWPITPLIIKHFFLIRHSFLVHDILLCPHFLKILFSIGNLPQLTSMVESKGSGLNIQISTTTQGVSGKGKAHLEIDGVFSPAIADDATASEVK